MKNIEDMDTEEMVGWACGYLLIAIGEGRFRAAMYAVVQSIFQVAYNRGLKKGKE
jgi:hypothetical protein